MNNTTNTILIATLLILAITACSRQQAPVPQADDNSARETIPEATSSLDEDFNDLDQLVKDLPAEEFDTADESLDTVEQLDVQ